MLADLCGADRGPEEDPRFEVNYHLFDQTLQPSPFESLSEDDPHVESVEPSGKPPTGTSVKLTIFWA